MSDTEKILSERQRIISALTAARIEKGLSQQALADLIGTKRSNICRIEAGGQHITLDMLLKISTALGKDVSVILSERDMEADTDPLHRSSSFSLFRTLFGAGSFCRGAASRRFRITEGFFLSTAAVYS